MKEIKRIRLNKNRGWRGLAELICEDAERNIVHKMIFSFSPSVWNDLLDGFIVTQDESHYFVLNFDNIVDLPRRDQQRSVLIKSFVGTVISVHTYDKDDPLNTSPDDYNRILHFKMNRNNHTTSDWNCIGVRVIPNI